MLYQTINIQLPIHPYPVYVGQALLGNSELFRSHITGQQVMIVTQQNIADLYLSDLLQALSGYQCDVTYLPVGEQHKNLASWQLIIDGLVEKYHERSTTLIALGGGVVGDMIGFAAACYLRGVNYIQVPTTLIAQVDAAIGGKTGINHPSGKNLIGAFYHPQCVIADTTVLQTLPKREYIAGLAEVIKYGLIGDADFFSWLEENIASLIQGEREALWYAIGTSVRMKGNIIAQDDRERAGVRSLLNFGHTIGHALEALFNYRTLLHGEAVAIGMNMAANISRELEWISENDYSRIQGLLRASGLPTELPAEAPLDLLPYLKRDKKVSHGQLKMVLLKSIGHAVLTEVSEETLLNID